VTKQPQSPGSDGASPYQAGASRLSLSPSYIAEPRPSGTVIQVARHVTKRPYKSRFGRSLTLPGASPDLRRHSRFQVWRVWWFYQFHGRDRIGDRTDERAFFELIQIVQDMLLDL
jgi:hypothetical protein